jgi:signal transduction histidine kinase
VPALHTYMKSLAARTGLRIRLTAGKEAEHLDVAHRTVLFRVAQEALTNVARHAAAENVQVVLQPEPGGFCLKITDDGRSFRVDRALHTTRGERLGLLGMRERLEMVGGRLELTSAPGVGTTVTAHVPLVAPSPNPKS